MIQLKYLCITLLLVGCFSSDAMFNLVKLNSKSALCLDGSPGAYYLSEDGDQKKIYLEFQGGGWCGQKDLPTTIQSCYQRSKTSLGSTVNYTARSALNQGSLSIDPANNFKDWKRVLITYCDGSGHQGSKQEPIQYKGQSLYFRGHNITVEILESLEKTIKLFSEATHVVVGGDSAGGLAVFTWTNYIADRVKVGKVWSLPDSGIFLDAVNVITKTQTYREWFINLMKISNVEIDSPVTECNRDFPTNKVNCFFAQNLHKYIKVPLFAIESLYDTWSIHYILGISCVNGSSLAKCTDAERKVIQQYHQNTTKVLKQITSRQKNGAWAPACANHVYARGPSYYNLNFRIPQNSENSASKTVQNWIEGNSKTNEFIDSQEWPNNKPCSGVSNLQKLYQ